MIALIGGMPCTHNTAQDIRLSEAGLERLGRGDDEIGDGEKLIHLYQLYTIQALALEHTADVSIHAPAHGAII